MKKLILILIFLTAAIIGFLSIAPSFIDKSFLQNHIAEKFYNLGYKVEFANPPVVSLFKNEVKLKGVKITSLQPSAQTLIFKDIKITPKFLSYFSDEFSIKKVELHTGEFSFDLQNLFTISPAKLDIEEIYLRNITLNIAKNNEHLDINIKHLNSQITEKNGQFKVTAEFDNQNQHYQANFNLDNENKKFNFSFSNQVLSILANASKNENSYAGELQFKLINMNKYLNFINDYFFLPSYDSQNPVTIASKFAVIDKNLRLSDLKSPEGYVDFGNSVIELDLENINALNIDLLINEINFDKIFANTKPTTNENTQNKTIDYFEISKSFDILINAEIKSILLGNNIIKNFSLNSEVFNGKYNVYNLSGTLNEDVNVVFNGTLTTNKIRPSFNGLFEIKTANNKKLLTLINPDLFNLNAALPETTNLSGSFTISPKNINLYNVNAQVGQDINIALNYDIKFEQNFIDTMLDLKVNNLDLDSEFLSPMVASMQDYLEDILTNKTSEKINNLRSTALKHKMVFNLENINFNKQNYKSIGGEIGIEKGLFKLKDVNFKNDNDNFSLDFAFNIQALKPKFDLKITGENINFDSAYNYLTDLNAEETKENILLDQEKVEVPKAITASLPAYFSDKPFKIYDIGQFDGSININLSAASSKNLKFSDVEIKGTLENFVLKLEKISAKLEDSTIDVNGSVIFNPLGFSLSYALNSINIEQLASYFNLNQIQSGYFSIAGNGTTQGFSMNQLANSLNVNFSLLATNVILNNYDLDKVTDIVFKNRKIAPEQVSTITDEAVKSGQTFIQQLSFSGQTNQNIIAFDKMEFSTDYTKGAAAGYFDPRTLELNLNSKIAFNAPNRNFPLAISLMLSGPIFEPVKKLDISEVLNYMQSQNFQRQ